MVEPGSAVWMGTSRDHFVELSFLFGMVMESKKALRSLRSPRKPSASRQMDSR